MDPTGESGVPGIGQHTASTQGCNGTADCQLKGEILFDVLTSLSTNPASIGKTIVVTGVKKGAKSGFFKKALRGIKSLFGKKKNGADSAKNKVNLEKQLASEEQLAQLSNGGGTVISQPAKQAARIANQTGRKKNDIQKFISDSRVASDGQKVETHAFRDSNTNELIEPKTIINN